MQFVQEELTAITSYEEFMEIVELLKKVNIDQGNIWNYLMIVEFLVKKSELKGNLQANQGRKIV